MLSLIYAGLITWIDPNAVHWPLETFMAILILVLDILIIALLATVLVGG